MSEKNILKEAEDLIFIIQTLKDEVGVKSKILNERKIELRIFLIDSAIKEYMGVKISRSFSSLDLELLRLEQPELFERYCKREEHTITTFDNTITKDNLKKIQEEHPEIWNDQDYRKELTARLSGL